MEQVEKRLKAQEQEIERLREKAEAWPKIAKEVGERQMQTIADLKDRLQEAEYLLHVVGPDGCPEWKEGVGDCDTPECIPCRIRRLSERNMKDD